MMQRRPRRSKPKIYTNKAVKKGDVNLLFAGELKGKNIPINLVYCKVDNEYIGSYLGHDQYGEYEINLFWLKSDGDVMLSPYVGNCPPKFRTALDLLNSGLDYYNKLHGEPNEEWDTYKPSRAEAALKRKDGVITVGDRWEYWSPNFDRSVVTALSVKWELQISWD